MSETVIRHRGAKRDENGKLTQASNVPLEVIGIAPGGGSQRIDRGRSGEDIACTVYLKTGSDVVDGDELTVRNKRYRIIVNDWLMSGRGGLEVLCKRGQG